MTRMLKKCIEARKQIRKFFQNKERKTRDDIRKKFFPHIFNLNKKGEGTSVKCKSCYEYYKDRFDQEMDAISWARGMGPFL